MPRRARMRMLRLLMLALAGATAFASATADACSRDPRPGDRQLFDEARQVFAARVVSTQVKRMPRKDCEDVGLAGGDCDYVEARYELVESFKGRPPRRGRVSELVFAPGNCSLGLLAGHHYVFYLVPGNDWVPFIQGSFPLGPSYDAGALEATRGLHTPARTRPRMAD